MRKVLPLRRASESFTLAFQGELYDITVGRYNSNRIGEVFINRRTGKAASKVSTLLDGICRDSAILLSLALQHGTRMETICHAVTRDEDNTPATIVGAIVDLLMKESPDGSDGTTPRNGDEPTPSGPDAPTSDGDTDGAVVEPPRGSVPETVSGPELPSATIYTTPRGEWSGKDLVHPDPVGGRYRGLRDRD